jgi:hypothetical protein
MQSVPDTGTFTRRNQEIINDNFAQLTQPDIWVRPQYGKDTNAGTYAAPLATMAGAARFLRPGIVIGLQGVLFEQYTGPIVGDVTIRGMANTPRQATTSGVPNGGGATWLSPTGLSNSLALCLVQGQGWRFENIYFNNSATSAACVKLSRAGDPPLAADASHASFFNCRMTGAAFGIEDVGGCGFVTIDGCEFFNFSGAGDHAIKNTSTAQALPLDWLIQNSKFWGNANHIVAPASGWRVLRNQIAAATTVNINFTGGTAPNFVQQNAFSIAAADFDPAGGVTGVTGDVWSNYLTDTIETGLPAN